MTTQISELGRAQRRVRPVSPVAARGGITTVEPVPRIALTQQEACASLGCSEEFFVEHVRPYLRVVRRGRKRLFPVAELRPAVDEMAGRCSSPDGHDAVGGSLPRRDDHEGSEWEPISRYSGEGQRASGPTSCKAGDEHRGASREGLRERRGKRCNCVAHYRGEVRDARGRKVRSAWSTSRAQAVAWEDEAVVAVRRGRLGASTPTTVRQAGIALAAGMRSGAILDRSGKHTSPRPSAATSTRWRAASTRCSGSRKVSSLRRADIQGFVEEMRELGAAPSTVHNRLDPLRVIVRRSIDNDELLVDPCARLKMPVVRNRRTRIESSTTAEALIAALPESEQAFWALALFAGVRRGELRGLQVDDVDFDAGLVHVRRGWDDLEGEIDRKRSPAPARSR